MRRRIKAALYLVILAALTPAVTVRAESEEVAISEELTEMAASEEPTETAAAEELSEMKISVESAECGEPGGTELLSDGQEYLIQEDALTDGGVDNSAVIDQCPTKDDILPESCECIETPESNDLTEQVYEETAESASDEQIISVDTVVTDGTGLEDRSEPDENNELEDITDSGENNEPVDTTELKDNACDGSETGLAANDDCIDKIQTDFESREDIEESETQSENAELNKIAIAVSDIYTSPEQQVEEIDSVITDSVSSPSVDEPESECTAAVVEKSVISAKVNTASDKKYTGWRTENGKQYWYENGIKQGTTGRGKEIYDPGSDAWYWLDAVQGGAKAVSKDVYMESAAGQFADRDDGTGKWVRYDKNGHMIKGWQTVGGKTYYFDLTYGSMAHGKVMIEKLPCWFDETTGIGRHLIWEKVNNQNYYWYEQGKRQGYDPNNSAYRGKEIYDPSDDAWYWLDNNAQGKKAVSKDVFQPYTYQGKDNEGKWVRYDSDGRMVKGWDSNENGVYYFDNTTGAMKKGTVTIANENVNFDVNTGIMTSAFTPGLFISAIEKTIKDDMKSNGILASLSAAQAYLESGYGNSKLTKEANNLFGIKGFYNGNSVTMTTQEYIGGRWVTQKDIFRKYPSWKESVADHSDLFNTLSRYTNLRNLTNYRAACTYVREDGYATDPMYTVKLISVIKKNELNKWDGAGSSSGYSSLDRDVEVTASSLNVRSSASTAGSVLTSLPRGMVVVIDQVIGNWGRLADYQSGWICLDYVKNY